MIKDTLNNRTIIAMYWGDNTFPGDYEHYIENLYRKDDTGEFFLYGRGERKSKYAKKLADGSYIPGEKTISLSKSQAIEWIKKHPSTDINVPLSTSEMIKWIEEH